MRREHCAWRLSQILVPGVGRGERIDRGGAADDRPVWADRSRDHAEGASGVGDPPPVEALASALTEFGDCNNVPTLS